MNSQTELSQQDLLFNLIKLAYRRLHVSYSNEIFNDSEYGGEKADEILEILALAVNEIDRLTNEK